MKSLLQVTGGLFLSFGLNLKAEAATLFAPLSPDLSELVVTTGGPGASGGGKICNGIGVDLSTCPGVCPASSGDSCRDNLCQTSIFCPTHDCHFFSGSFSPATSGCYSCSGNYFYMDTSSCGPSPTPSPTPFANCRQPEQDNGSGGCKFYPDRHRCDDGSVSGLASATSGEISGMDRATQFKNAVNKKLACCLNGYTQGDVFSKFDCIENSKKRYADFNELWVSSDAPSDGGQMNAMILVSASGAPITGFYTLNGVRCNEFNEFGGELRPAKVNPILTNAQMNRAAGADPVQNIGSVLDLPTSDGYALINQRVVTKGIKVPTTAADRRRCPLLVRAATTIQCPSNPVPPAVQRSYIESGTTVRRCATASSVQVHVRVEQLTEIAGTPKMQPIDTVLDAKNAAAISIDQVLANKYGNRCPPGTRRSGDACVEN